MPPETIDLSGDEVLLDDGQRELTPELRFLRSMADQGPTTPPQLPGNFFTQQFEDFSPGRLTPLPGLENAQRRRIGRGLAASQFSRPQLSSQQMQALDDVRKAAVSRGLRGGAVDAAVSRARERFGMGNRRAGLSFLAQDLATSRGGSLNAFRDPRRAELVDRFVSQADAFGLLSRTGVESEALTGLLGRVDQADDAFGALSEEFGLDRLEFSSLFDPLTDPSPDLRDPAIQARERGITGADRSLRAVQQGFGRRPAGQTLDSLRQRAQNLRFTGRFDEAQAFQDQITQLEELQGRLFAPLSF